jgi:pyrroloquinoline quinone biosynthesis protein B
MNIKFLVVLISLVCYSCDKGDKTIDITLQNAPSDVPYITILGIAQDGGYPHINNNEEFNKVANNPALKELVVSLGLVDPVHKSKYLFEATPDMPEQLAILERDHLKNNRLVDGIFLTHAHVGHYTGLMHLGREAMGSKNIRVIAMPRMKTFLETNGPWDQLVALNNIKILPLQADVSVKITPQLAVTPFLVPHRDEYSETVGYHIKGPHKSALFIPDIDKWDKWDKNILEEVQKVDYAFLDATFFADGEIPRHPFVEEKVNAFAKADSTTKSKVIFIHFNHSNPALKPDFIQRQELEKQGFRFAKQDQILSL